MLKSDGWPQGYKYPNCDRSLLQWTFMNTTIRLYSLRRLYPSISQVLLGMSFSKVIGIPGVKFLDQRSRSLHRLKVLELSAKPPACCLALMGYFITSCPQGRPSSIDRPTAFPTIEISRCGSWACFGSDLDLSLLCSYLSRNATNAADLVPTP